VTEPDLSADLDQVCVDRRRRGLRMNPKQLETRGNPPALLELPRGVTAGVFAVAPAAGLSSSIEDGFRRQLDTLPADTRRLLQLAAADPVGEPLLVWRAALGESRMKRVAVGRGGRAIRRGRHRTSTRQTRASTGLQITLSRLTSDAVHGF